VLHPPMEFVPGGRAAYQRKAQGSGDQSQASGSPPQSESVQLMTPASQNLSPAKVSRMSAGPETAPQ
jgi:hypothetical protein